MDVRKNVCRLWMAFDELRISVNKICSSIDRMRGAEEARGSSVKITFSLLGALIGATATFIAHIWIR